MVQKDIVEANSLVNLARFGWAMHQQGSPLQPAGDVLCYDAPLRYWLAARLLAPSPALLSCLAMQHEPSLQQVANVISFVWCDFGLYKCWHDMFGAWLQHNTQSIPCLTCILIESSCWGQPACLLLLAMMLHSFRSRRCLGNKLSAGVAVTECVVYNNTV